MVDVKIIEERQARWRKSLEGRRPAKPQSPEIPEFEITYSKTWSEIRRARNIRSAQYWAKKRADVLTAEVVSVEPHGSHSPEVYIPVTRTIEGEPWADFKYFFARDRARLWAGEVLRPHHIRYRVYRVDDVWAVGVKPEEVERAKGAALLVPPSPSHGQEELDVVKPETVERWRRWGIPEDIIGRLVEQRRRAAEARRVEEWITVPGYAYEMPRLPEIEERAWGFAKTIDAEGSIVVASRAVADKIARIDRWLYRYEYFRPRVRFHTFTYDFTEEVANMMLSGVSIERVFDRLTRKYVIRYVAVCIGSRAVRICYLIEPHLSVPEKRERARQILATYRERPSTPA